MTSDLPWYQDKERLEQEIKKHGSRSATATATGVSENTIRRWCRRLGIAHSPQTIAIAGEAVSREELLDHENRELKAALTQARKGTIRDERIIQTLERLVPRLETQYEPLKPRERKSKETPHAFVLQWSDLHAAERVFSDQLGGVNEYDWAIMLERHDKIIASIESFLANRPYPVPELYIAGLGDHVTGDIHDELRVTNEMVVMETALTLGADGAKFIERLVPLFEKIRFVGIVGNHGRTQKKPQMKNQHDNFDWMVYNLFRVMLERYPSVTVEVPKAPYAQMLVQDRWNCFLWHGDGVSTNMPGVPWGGILRRTRELERQFEHWGRIDHFLLGHFHQPNIVDNRRVIVNGSIKGPDEYSVKRFGAGSPASQNLLTFHPTRGLTDVSFLDLQ